MRPEEYILVSENITCPPIENIVDIDDRKGEPAFAASDLAREVKVCVPDNED